MAEPQEISYADAFAPPQAANTNAPPEVPMSGAPGGQREMTYQEAFPPPAPPSVLRQIIDPTAAIDNALPSGSLYQSVKNIASAFGEGIKQTGDDIGKNLSSRDGGELVQSLKASGMFQPYVEDQNNFDKGFFYKTAYPAIYNMVSRSGEMAARGLAIAGNVATAPLNIIGGALGQATEEIPEGGIKELAQYAMNSPLLAETEHMPIREALDDIGRRVPRPVAEGEASGIVGTTEGQNAGVEPLTEDQHIRQAAAESEVNPIRAAEPITEIPRTENDIHMNARILDPETFKQYDQLAATRDDLRSKLAENPPNAYEIQQQLQETNAGMRELAPKVSDAYLQAQQFEKQPESVKAEEMAGALPIEPLPEQVAALAKEPEKISPIAADITQKLVAVGRPAEEAQASGEVAARMYQYFADAYGGEKGTAQDWYNRESAEIKGAKERATTLAQPGEGGEELKQEGTAPTFYSALTRTVENAPQEKASADQWAATIRNAQGLKKEELEWSGVNDWLKEQKGQVTKQEITDYLKAHEVNVQEVEKGAGNTLEQYKVVRPDGVSDGIYATKEQADARANEIKGHVEQNEPVTLDNTKFSQYTLPGGKNYRELLLALPESTKPESFEDWYAKTHVQDFDKMSPRAQELVRQQYEKEGQKVGNSNNFHTSHFDEPNILSHVRFNDRTGPNGEKILHLEEIQSDWHQKGRKQGYAEPLGKTIYERKYANGDLAGQHDTEEEAKRFMAEDPRGDEQHIEPRNVTAKGVPNAPFKTSWPELAMKRMIRYAAENGYDKISWTTGEQQAARYDLSRQIKQISASKEPNGKYLIYIEDKHDNPAFRNVNGFSEHGQKSVTPQELEDLIGKEAAKNMIEGADKKSGDWYDSNPSDLKVGGEGMKGFYDKILPSIADKLGKKFGTKTGETTIDTTTGLNHGFQYSGPTLSYEQTVEKFHDLMASNHPVAAAQQMKDVAKAMRDGADFRTAMEQQGSPMLAEAIGGELGETAKAETVHSLPITDAMRESVMQGQPLFQSTKGKIRLATDDAHAVISLMKNADASTFVHESAHHFLDMMDRFSKEDEAPAQLKADMAIIRKWTGLSEKPYETPKEKRAYVQAQEKFARGFERYLMEGVAPSRDMALVFAKFKSWLTTIYRTVFSIPNQKGSINEDVRAFFDRVLSTTPERTVIAPNHPAELGLKANIESPRLGDLFGTVPKAPKTLTEWLSANGGIKDDGTGDLASMDANKAHIDLKTGKAKAFVSKLVKDDGMDLDTAARAAQEAGYFPEKGGERPTVEELKSKLLEDLSGNKQYSDADQEALRNHLEGLKYNAETDRISHATGIDPAGKTHERFWDEVNQYYEDEKRYNEAQDIASGAEKDYAEYERKEREFIESRGEAWEAPKEPEPATLEDLENERKQEIAADDAATGASNAQEPASTAGVSQPGEAGVRQGGNVPEPDGRQGQSEVEANEQAARQRLDAARANIANAAVGDAAGPESKPATRPNEQSGKSEFIDKAGNIRLDLLTDSNSVKAAMREAAEKNPQVFNHGVITDAQVAEFADAMGTDAKNLNIQKLREMSVNDDIPLAARIRSGSKMMVDALNHSLELMNKANPTDDDVLKFLEAKKQFLMISETVSATTNQMGRGFRAYNNLMKEYNVTDINEAAELFQRMTGKTLDQIKAEMKAGSILKTPKQIARFTQDSQKPDFFDKLIEYRNNSLLSGPVTHTFYTAGGFLNAAYKPLQTLSGVAVQGIREAFGDEITQRQYAHEAFAQFQALGYGAMRGLKVAAESWRRSEEVALPGEVTSTPLLNPLKGMQDIEGMTGTDWLPSNQAISGKLGAVINVPSRVIRSIHSFLKALNYQQNMAGLAVRDALDKGLLPGTDDYNKFVSDTIDNPSPKMMDDAGKASLKEVYREKVNWNSTPGKLFNIVNSNPVTKVLFPFIKMQYNIKRLAFRDNSVLGFFSPDIRADISGINGDVAKNMAIGKIAAGTAVAGLGISMTMQGLNNGGGPSDPKAYKTWRLTHAPYAVQIGSIVIPHKALGTLGQLLGWSADMAEGAHEFDPNNIEKSAWQFVRKAGAIFTEEGFLTQAKNTLDAAFTPEQFGTRFIQNFATQWLPFSVGASQTNRLLNDPYARRVKSLGAENAWGIPESMEYKYPGTSELLQPMRDMFGQPVTFASSYDKYANDPVVQKLESLQTGIGRLNDKIKGVQLTEQQYDDYSRIAGQMTYARLSKIVGMAGFDKMPPQHQIQMIEKTTTESRELAANQIMKMNPQIMRQAVAKKKLSIYGNKAVNDAQQSQIEDTVNP